MVRFRNLGQVAVQVGGLVRSLDLLPAPAPAGPPKGRDQLLHELEADQQQVQVPAKQIRALVHALLADYTAHPLAAVALLKHVMRLLEWLQSRASLTASELLLLARVHYELWHTDIAGHPWHLAMAVKYFTSAPSDDPGDILMHVRSLQASGAPQQAEDLLKLSLPVFECLTTYPNVLLTAGGICKVNNKLETANAFFFESSQLGPPKFFSKLEMMVVISRLIEEGGGDEEDGGNDEAYQMVSPLHLLCLSACVAWIGKLTAVLSVLLISLASAPSPPCANPAFFRCMRILPKKATSPMRWTTRIGSPMGAHGSASRTSAPSIRCSR